MGFRAVRSACEPGRRGRIIGNWHLLSPVSDQFAALEVDGLAGREGAALLALPVREKPRHVQVSERHLLLQRVAVVAAFGGGVAHPDHLVLVAAHAALDAVDRARGRRGEVVEDEELRASRQRGDGDGAGAGSEPDVVQVGTLELVASENPALVRGVLAAADKKILLQVVLDPVMREEPLRHGRRGDGRLAGDDGRRVGPERAGGDREPLRQPPLDRIVLVPEPFVPVEGEGIIRMRVPVPVRRIDLAERKLEVFAQKLFGVHVRPRRHRAEVEPRLEHRTDLLAEHFPDVRLPFRFLRRIVPGVEGDDEEVGDDIVVLGRVAAQLAKMTKMAFARKRHAASIPFCVMSKLLPAETQQRGGARR